MPYDDASPEALVHPCEYGLLLLFCSPFLPLSSKPRMPKPSTILGAMKAELARSQQAFKTEPVQPYFLSYEITDDQVVNVTGTFGKLQTSQQSRSRQLDIDLRVGTPIWTTPTGRVKRAPSPLRPSTFPLRLTPTRCAACCGITRT